jgi:hypothetical protein
MPVLFVGLCTVFGIFFTILSTAVLIFRLACQWCNLERPSFLGASGIVILSWLTWFGAEAAMIGVLQEVYVWAGYPMWEARFVGFFLGLPFHMTVASVLHVAVMRVTAGKAIEVWFMQQMILLAIALCLLAVVGVFFLLK